MDESWMAVNEELTWGGKRDDRNAQAEKAEKAENGQIQRCRK